jgi:hypothetical protein
MAFPVDIPHRCRLAAELARPHNRSRVAPAQDPLQVGGLFDPPAFGHPRNMFSEGAIGERIRSDPTVADVRLPLWLARHRTG